MTGQSAPGRLLGKHPDLSRWHPQTTLSCSRKATIRSCAVALVDHDLAAPRLGLRSTTVISCLAPAAPTARGVEAEVGDGQLSTGLDLAAMIPLNEGYRGSTTPAVTVTTAGSGHSTSS